MGASHGKNAKVLVNQYDLSSFLNEANTSKTVDTAETTTFGAGSITRIAGLGDGKYALKGVFDGSAAGIDAIVQPLLVSATDDIFTIAQAGLAIGNPAHVGAGVIASYETSSPVKDVVTASMDVEADGGLDLARVLAGLRATAFAQTDNATSVDNAASTANGGVAVAHLSAFTLGGGGTATVKVQHSVDNSTWADLATVLSGATAVGSAAVVVAAGTTVNRYLRAQITTTGSSGSVTTTLSFARR